MRLTPLVLLYSACSGGPASVLEDSAAEGGFCSTLDDGNVFNVLEGGGNAASGDLELRLLSNETTDPHDPMYTAFKPYTLENTETQGVQTTDETSGDGLVHELLGAGPWLFRASYTRGANTCTAELAVDIVANSTTQACAVLTCPY